MLLSLIPSGRTLFSGLVVLASLACASTSLAQPAAETEHPADLLLILDASGSMWGQIDGENKVVIARRVVGQMIDGLPAGQRVGLVAYGHRKDGDCEDIELVVPMGPLDKKAFKGTVDSLNPKGKTPITASLQKAFEVVRGNSAGTTMILLSDGLETCGSDPCAAVQAAKKEGLNLLLHVIGFDVAKEDVSQLECAAQAGGGQFISAENADQLSLALNTAVTLAVDAPAGGLSIKAITNGELQDAWIFVKGADGTDTGGSRTYGSPKTNPRFMPLAPGAYTVTVRALGMKGDIERKLEVTIAEDAIVEREVDFSVGEVKVGATQNGDLLDATVNIYAAGTKDLVAAGRTYTGEKSNPKPFSITPGTYDVELKALRIGGSQVHRWEGVVVEPNGSSTITHAFDSGTLRVGVRRGDELIDATVNVIDIASNSSHGAGRTYTAPNNNPKSFTLMPGKYTVKIKELRGDGVRQLTVEVQADAVQEVLIDLNVPE